LDIVIAQTFAGLSQGGVLLLIALGLALTFGQMGVINNAHGEFVMVGAYTAYLVQQVVEDPNWAFPISLLAGFLAAGLLGLILEVVLISRMYHRPLDTLLVTFGVALIMQQAARDIFGAPNVDVRGPEWLSGMVQIGGAAIPKTRLFILVLALACLAGLAATLKNTALGRRIRATVQNRDLAQVTGISTRAADRTTFFLGSGIAGLAGVAITLLGSIGPTLGVNYIVDAFLVVVAGGIGHLSGAAIAAFTLGLIQAGIEYSTTTSTAKVAVLVIIVLFLQARPQGLIVRRVRSLA
jgi:urea transport system permease protein